MTTETGINQEILKKKYVDPIEKVVVKTNVLRNKIQFDENAKTGLDYTGAVMLRRPQGFTFAGGPDAMIWNTFDCHRLLHWAEKAGNAHALKMALFDAHFTRGQPLNDPETLIAAARAAGLDADAARDVLDSGRYAEDVRANQRWWREEQDITAVPAIIFNGKYAIMGGQPPATFEKVIRRIVAGEI
jgi:predicted DsbA family dithiol-disulfide isomerase